MTAKYPKEFRDDVVGVALIIRANGVDDSHVSDDDWYDLIMKVASTRVQVDELADMLQTLLHSPSG